METVECVDCGKQYSEVLKHCPVCGSYHKRLFISVHSEIGIKSEITGMQGKKPGHPGKHKVRWKWTDKDTVQRGDGRTPIHFYQLIDRDNNLYEETVVNLETGEVIRDCREPLSDHIGHGSDKIQRDTTE